MSNDSPATPSVSHTPWTWRLALAFLVVSLGYIAYLTRDTIGPRGQAAFGVVCFFLFTAIFSANLRRVNWRTIGMGILLQVLLALFVLKLQIGDSKPGKEMFDTIGKGITRFLEFSNKGSEFVFGPLTNLKDPERRPLSVDKQIVVFAPIVGMSVVVVEQPVLTDKQFVVGKGFIFAIAALPSIIFVSSFFTLLYYFGVLQLLVKVMARIMSYLMGTSGAESLSASANVFMGQTEAPLIVKPYVRTMTQSELLALMAGGMATVSGGIMAVYIACGADPLAILATSVMAAPCGLYLAKLVLPEMEEPLTRGEVKLEVEQPYSNAIDAAAGGAAEGLKLALNVAGMLIAFVALVAMIDALLQLIDPSWSLKNLFATVFWPAAMLIGVEGNDIPKVADLLGWKLAVNEVFAFGELKAMTLDPVRSKVLATFALTSFANFASIGIQLGGIGAMAPERRKDLANLGLRALLVGFMATLINAAMAGILL
jgi:CNT family concentrative nucleoside transporter